MIIWNINRLIITTIRWRRRRDRRCCDNLNTRILSKSFLMQIVRSLTMWQIETRIWYKFINEHWFNCFFFFDETQWKYVKWTYHCFCVHWNLRNIVSKLIYDQKNSLSISVISIWDKISWLLSHITASLIRISRTSGDLSSVIWIWNFEVSSSSHNGWLFFPMFNLFIWPN